MHTRPGLSALFALAIPAVLSHAQDADLVKSLSGWSRMDPTGAATFYVPARKALVTWMRDGGVLSQIDTSKVEMIPERWIVDDDRIWIMAGTTLKQLNKAGQVLKTQTLPAEIGDVDFLPPDGMVLSYRTVAPYVEKRDLKGGSVSWSYGTKPKKGEPTAQILHRVLRNQDGQVLIASKGDMAMVSLDGKKGTLLGQSVFTYRDAMPPTLALGARDRGSVVWCWGKSLAYAAIQGSALPGSTQQTLSLARLDFTSSTVEFLPTLLPEDSTLVGIAEDQAAILTPNAGLVFLPVK